jgi:hypothetical protein
LSCANKWISGDIQCLYEICVSMNFLNLISTQKSTYYPNCCTNFVSIYSFVYNDSSNVSTVYRTTIYPWNRYYNVNIKSTNLLLLDDIISSAWMDMN